MAAAPGESVFLYPNDRPAEHGYTDLVDLFPGQDGGPPSPWAERHPQIRGNRHAKRLVASDGAVAEPFGL